MMSLRKSRYITLFIICFLTAVTGNSIAQGTNNETKKSESNRPSLKAVKMSGQNEITIDGKLDEPIWQQAPVATGFIQREPHDGKPATEKTEVKIVYSNDAIYLGARAYDSAMDSVAATLFRKDGDAYSDWLFVAIDSYNDNRTAFAFGVNPRGVRQDLLLYNDNNDDQRWDAVWEAKTQVKENAWAVEMRIPLSQLRFDARKQVQTWDINFLRVIARKEEEAFWSPTPQDKSGMVSQFGSLTGVSDLREPKRLEITPYTSGSLTRAPGDDANPFYSKNAVDGSLGADIKYGLSSDFTLTGTINPDFGQVEADPAVINLSAFETYFPEQRPFFLEGTDIFEFGRTETYNSFGNPLVFYSRRIGRQPQGQLPASSINSRYVDTPDQTTIAGAAKVSGKTNNGFSLGLLNAFTLREKARYVTFSDEEGRLSVEPPSNYFVGRVKQDINNGRTIIGAFSSAVNRLIGEDYLEQTLHSSAYIGGVDFEHSWNDRDYILSGVFSSSSVNGAGEAISRTQQSSARYYNRVDADHLSVDPTKTSLSGYATELSFARYGGKHWRGSITYSSVSPGYEVNDLGFENRADYHATSYLLQYRNDEPGSIFRFFNVNLYSNHAWNFGGDMINNSYGLSSNYNFTNLWRINLNAGFNGKRFSDRLLRGGPLSKQPISYYYSAVVSSNESKPVSFALGHLRWQHQKGGKERDAFLDLTIRPTSYIQLTLSPNINFELNTDQYVETFSDELASNTYDRRYVFADLDQTTFSTGFRLDWTFTPDITLQTYLRPFITSGNFRNYKEFMQPGEYNFAVYGEERGSIEESDGTYTVDPDGSGPSQSFSFEERDFNFKSIQTNAVFRWEYNPGSILYVVWQQDRSASTLHDDFRFSRDINRLFDTSPTNVFLIKFSYWFGT